MTLKSVKLTEEAIEAVNDFKKQFQLKNQSDAVILGLGWALQFFHSDKQVKDDLITRVKQHDIILNSLIKRQGMMDGAITKLWLQNQVLMELNPEAQEKLKKLIAEVKKAKAELSGVVTTKTELKGEINEKESR